MATALEPGIFKSYDVRGIYPDELSDDAAYAIGGAFVEQFGLRRIVVGRDMRPSGVALFEAFARGANEAGADVTDVGLVSTDALYFAVGKYGFDGGVMITASHNPAEYNGLKLTRERAQALSLDTGLSEIRDRILAGTVAPAPRRGTIERRDILDDFAAHCLSFIDPVAIRPFKIAIDAGNGMAGITVPRVFAKLPCAVVPLVLRTRWVVPEPSGEPDRAREHGRPAAGGAGERLRPRRRVRRRRRPNVHRRREGRPDRRRHGDRARRHEFPEARARRAAFSTT